MLHFLDDKFLDAGIQDVSRSISIVHDLIERYPDDDESDKHIKARGRRYSCLIRKKSILMRSLSKFKILYMKFWGVKLISKRAQKSSLLPWDLFKSV